MKIRIAIVAIVLGATAAARAALPPMQEKRLANGLDVLVVEDHAVPLVTIEIAVRNGSMTEPPDYNGLSHLYEHMFFKANKIIVDQSAFLEKVKELGIVLNGTTQTE